MSTGSASAAALRAAIDIGIAQLDASLRVALPRCGPKNAKNLCSVQYHSTAAASRHTFVAAARRLRYARADVFGAHLHEVRKPKTSIVSSPALTLPSSGAKRFLKRNCSKKALTACRSSSYTKLQSAEDRFITKGAL
jgi:hypothetical protein